MLNPVTVWSVRVFEGTATCPVETVLQRYDWLVLGLSNVVFVAFVRVARNVVTGEGGVLEDPLVYVWAEGVAVFDLYVYGFLRHQSISPGVTRSPLVAFSDQALNAAFKLIRLGLHSVCRRNSRSVDAVTRFRSNSSR